MAKMYALPGLLATRSGLMHHFQTMSFWQQSEVAILKIPN